MLYTSNLVPTGGAAKATTSIVNYFSSGTPAGSIFQFNASSGIKASNSGALTAATLQTMINITGSAGKMPVLALRTLDATARTMRIKVTTDGSNVVFDSTSALIAILGYGMVVAGCDYGSTGANIADGEPISWKTSCLVQIASSLTETDKFQIGYKYFLES